MGVKACIEKRAKEIMEQNNIRLDMLDEVVESAWQDSPDGVGVDQAIWDAIHDWDLA